MDLSGYKKVVESMKELGHAKYLPGESKRLLVRLIDEGHLKPNQLLKDIKVDRKVLSAWRVAIRNSSGLKSGDGRPKKIDKLAQDELIRDLVMRRKQRNTADSNDFNKIISKAVRDTSLRIMGTINRTFPARETIRRVKKDLDVRDVKGQRTTNVRQQANADLRNHLTEGICLLAFANHVNPHLLLNIDDTQYFAHNGGVNGKLVIVHDKADRTPATKTSSGKVIGGMFIKSRVLITAGGCIGPMCMMIANEKVSEGTMRVVPVLGLTNMAAIDRVGYMVFVNSRGLCDQVFEWYLEYVICPFVRKTRRILVKSLDTAESHPSYFGYLMQDGEATQLNCWMQSGHCLNLLHNHDILATNLLHRHQGRLKHWMWATCSKQVKQSRSTWIKSTQNYMEPRYGDR